MNVGKRDGARVLACYAAFKALENRRFSASYRYPILSEIKSLRPLYPWSR